jgi:transcription initiation factor TFIID subunit TAF12
LPATAGSKPQQQQQQQPQQQQQQQQRPSSASPAKASGAAVAGSSAAAAAAAAAGVTRCNLSDPACTPGTHEFETAAAKVRDVLEAYKAKTKQHLEAGVSGR